LYVEGEILAAPHLLQVLTDDDEIQLAYYFFDDTYLARHGDRAALLLLDGWKLPAGHAAKGLKPSERTTPLTPRGRGEGTTYVVIHGFWDSGNLYDLDGGYRIDGVRLPELARYLARTEPAEGEWPRDLALLKAELFPKGRKPKLPDDGFLHALRDDPANED